MSLFYVSSKISRGRGQFVYDNKSAISKNGYDIRLSSKIDILKALIDKADGEKLDMNISELSKIILGADLKTETKKNALSIINGRISHTLESVSKVVFDIVCDEEMSDELNKASSIEQWEEKVDSQADRYLELLPEDCQEKVIECIVREQAK